MKRPFRVLRLVMASVTLLGALGRPAAAQAPGYRARLDSLLDRLEQAQRTMGSVTVRRGDRVLYSRQLGFRDSTTGGWLRADVETAFRVGSIAKPFTAVMIFQLIDAGKLSLDTKLARFFPQLPRSDSITIRDLLGHTSGLPDHTQGLDVLVALTRDSLLRRIETGAVQFAPGTRRRYNNSNFLLLGYIIEHITGLSYAVQLDRAIVRPVGLRRTQVGAAVAAANNEARSYYFEDGHWAHQPDDAMENAGGAGNVVTTTADLTQFLSALFKGRLISRSSLRELTNGFNDGTRINGKGLGPFTIDGANKTGHSHNGSIGAYTALIGYVPSDSLSLALTVNGHNYPIDRIFFHVWDILYGVATPLPSFVAVELPAERASAYVGEYRSDAYGLTITVRRTTNGIEGHTTGQEPFPLTFIGRNMFMSERPGILVQFAEPVNGAAPRFTLFQQKLAIPLTRTGGTP
jgi:D-alanyl-D-alanine carboxypeptidase